MAAVGTHAGPTDRRSGRGPGRTANGSRGRTLGLAIGSTVTAIAWGLLVWAAIDFGGEARHGEPIAWAFLLLATLGAIACLFLAMTLVSKLVDALRTTPAPPRPAGGRRAKR